MTDIPDSCAELARMIISGNYKNVLVLTGAGISTAAGIPDFRSPSIGLYASLKSAANLKLRSPTFVFDLNTFKKDPKPFWWIFTTLWPKGQWPKPTDMHYFIGFLNKLGILKRVYTQNVDGLEIAAGLPEDKLVQCHGTLQTAHCYDCRDQVAMTECLNQIQPNFKNENLDMTNAVVPHCPKCGGEHVKPDVTFFGESLPARFLETLREDFDCCDLMIVSGTSLEVFPFANLVGRAPPEIPRFVINKDQVRPKGGIFKEIWNGIKKVVTLGLFNFSGEFDYGNGKDFFIGGDCQDAVRNIIEKGNLQPQFDEYKASCENIPDPLRTVLGVTPQ